MIEKGLFFAGVAAIAALAFLFLRWTYQSARWCIVRRIVARRAKQRGTERTIGSTYYCISGPLIHLSVMSYVDGDSAFDKTNFERGNYFNERSTAAVIMMSVEKVLKTFVHV
jgi:hypothetical protein